MKLRAAILALVLGAGEGGEVAKLETEAAAHLQAGKLAEAAAALRKKLALVEAERGGDDWRTADARREIQAVERRMALPSADLEALRAAEAKARRGLELGMARQFAEALPLATEAAGELRRLLGEDDAEYAVLLLGLAQLNQAAAQHERAQELYADARRRIAKALGEGHPQYAEALHHQANHLRSVGRYPEALPLTQKACEVYERTHGRPSLEFAGALEELGNALDGSGKRAEAGAAFEEVLTLRERLAGKAHPLYATALHNLGGSYMDRGQYARARPILEECLELTRKTSGEKHPDTALSWTRLGTLWRHLGDLEKAEEHYQRSADITREVFGERHLKYANRLNDLATASTLKGRYARAEEILVQALAIIREVLGEEHLHFAILLKNLARVYTDTGQYARAEPLVARTVEIELRILGKENDEYAASLHELALVRYYRGDLAAAAAMDREVLEITARTLGADHPDSASTLHTLAMVHAAAGDAASAEKDYLQALEIQKRVHGVNSVEYATTLQNLADLQAGLGRVAAAVPRFEEALAALKEAAGEKHPYYPSFLNNLGFALLAGGETERARAAVEEAAALERERFGAQSPRYGRRLVSLGSFAARAGDLERAEARLREGIELLAELGEESPVLASARRVLGETLIAGGRSAEAREPLALVLASALRRLERSAAFQSEREQLLLSLELRSALDAFLSAGGAGTGNAVEDHAAALAWKGAVALRQREAAALRRAPAFAGKVSELAEVTREMSSLALSLPEPEKRAEWREKIGRLGERREAVEREIAAGNAAFARAGKARRVTPGEIREALPEGTVLIDYLVYRRVVPAVSAGDGGKERAGTAGSSRGKAYESVPHLAAFVLARGAPPERVELGPLAEVEKAIAALRSALAPAAAGLAKQADEKAGSSVEAAAARLGALVWSPLAGLLRGARHAVISPDGPLGSVPYAALPGGNGRFLIEELALSFHSLPQLLPEAALRGGAGPTGAGEVGGGGRADAGSLLVVGDVDYDRPGTGPAVEVATRPAAAASGLDLLAWRGASAAAPRPAGRTWARLPGSRAEAQAVVASWKARQSAGEAAEVLASRATAPAFLAAAKGRAYIHVATHGFFAEPEFRSALAEEAKTPEAGTGRLLIGWHPGLLSGIVFAGANGAGGPGGDDGVLSAVELGEADLAGVELLVLSACETGLGASAGGEGLIGLQRAAEIAGARGVVASLWQVNDLEAQAFMRYFYDHLWRRSLPRLEALRATQLAFLRGEIDVASGGTERGPGAGKKLAPGEKARRVSPRAWAGWVLSGEWR